MLPIPNSQSRSGSFHKAKSMMREYLRPMKSDDESTFEEMLGTIPSYSANSFDDLLNPTCFDRICFCGSQEVFITVNHSTSRTHRDDEINSSVSDLSLPKSGEDLQHSKIKRLSQLKEEDLCFDNRDKDRNNIWDECKTLDVDNETDGTTEQPEHDFVAKENELTSSRSQHQKTEMVQKHEYSTTIRNVEDFYDSAAVSGDSSDEEFCEEINNKITSHNNTNGEDPLFNETWTDKGYYEEHGKESESEIFFSSQKLQYEANQIESQNVVHEYSNLEEDFQTKHRMEPQQMIKMSNDSYISPASSEDYISSTHHESYISPASSNEHVSPYVDNSMSHPCLSPPPPPPLPSIRNEKTNFERINKKKHKKKIFMQNKIDISMLPPPPPPSLPPSVQSGSRNTYNKKIHKKNHSTHQREAKLHVRTYHESYMSPTSSNENASIVDYSMCPPPPPPPPSPLLLNESIISDLNKFKSDNVKIKKKDHKKKDKKKRKKKHKKKDKKKREKKHEKSKNDLSKSYDDKLMGNKSISIEQYDIMNINDNVPGYISSESDNEKHDIQQRGISQRLDDVKTSGYVSSESEEDFRYNENSSNIYQNATSYIASASKSLDEKEVSFEEHMAIVADEDEPDTTQIIIEETQKIIALEQRLSALENLMEEMDVIIMSSDESNGSLDDIDNRKMENEQSYTTKDNNIITKSLSDSEQGFDSSSIVNKTSENEVGMTNDIVAQIDLIAELERKLASLNNDTIEALANNEPDNDNNENDRVRSEDYTIEQISSSTSSLDIDDEVCVQDNNDDCNTLNDFDSKIAELERKLESLGYLDLSSFSIESDDKTRPLSYNNGDDIQQTKILQKINVEASTLSCEKPLSPAQMTTYTDDQNIQLTTNETHGKVIPDNRHDIIEHNRGKYDQMEKRDGFEAQASKVEKVHQYLNRHIFGYFNK